MATQRNEKKGARERAAAARRAAQLRREAEERVAAEAKLDSGEDLETNDMLAMLGSALRLPADGTSTGAVPAQPTPKRRKSTEGYGFTAEAISALRDVQGLSWRQVATNLDLANPGQARKAYAELTGKDYHATETTKRTASVGLHGTARKFFYPEWDDNSNQDEIIERLTRAVIVVARKIGSVEFDEEIKVGTVQRLTWDGAAEQLCVHFSDWDTGGTRSVLVRNIKEVK